MGSHSAPDPEEPAQPDSAGAVPPLSEPRPRRRRRYREDPEPVTRVGGVTMVITARPRVAGALAGDVLEFGIGNTAEIFGIDQSELAKPPAQSVGRHGVPHEASAVPPEALAVPPRRILTKAPALDDFADAEKTLQIPALAFPVSAARHAMAFDGDSSSRSEIRLLTHQTSDAADTDDLSPSRLPGAAAEPDDGLDSAARWQAVLDGRKRKKRPLWVELPILILSAVVITFVVQTFVAKVYYIPSGSMETTLHGAEEGGDRVLVNKILYDFTDPAPGDVVVFRGPSTWPQDVVVDKPTTWYGKAFQAMGSVVGLAPPDEKDFVKRVIATGGQTVMCCDAEGAVMVDGKAVTEPYIFEDYDFQPGVLDCSGAAPSQRCFPAETIPAGMLWVMGDHRSNSSDSRRHGPISIDDVIGKAAFVVTPISRWQSIDDPDIQSGPGN